jgi:hypothetical protein
LPKRRLGLLPVRRFPECFNYSAFLGVIGRDNLLLTEVEIRTLKEEATQMGINEFFAKPLRPGPLSDLLAKVSARRGTAEYDVTRRDNLEVPSV